MTSSNKTSLYCDHYFKSLPFYETAGCKIRTFFKKKIQELKLPENPYVMDVGCGDGHWAIDLFPDAQLVYGFDLDQKRLERASRNFRSMQMGFKSTQLPVLSTKVDYSRINRVIPKNSIDTALVFGVFEFIGKEDIIEILRKIQSSLRENGNVIFTFHPARRFSALYLTTFIKSILSLKFDFTRRVDSHAGYPVNSITLKEFKIMASSIGFECIEMGGLNPFPLILKIHENKFFKRIIKKMPFFHTQSRILSHWYCTQYYIGKIKAPAHPA